MHYTNCVTAYVPAMTITAIALALLLIGGGCVLSQKEQQMEEKNNTREE